MTEEHQQETGDGGAGARGVRHSERYHGTEHAETGHLLRRERACEVDEPEQHRQAGDRDRVWPQEAR
jgi:hypothetical protein